MVPKLKPNAVPTFEESRKLGPEAKEALGKKLEDLERIDMITLIDTPT